MTVQVSEVNPGDYIRIDGVIGFVETNPENGDLFVRRRGQSPRHLTIGDTIEAKIEPYRTDYPIPGVDPDGARAGEVSDRTCVPIERSAGGGCICNVEGNLVTISNQYIYELKKAKFGLNETVSPMDLPK